MKCNQKIFLYLQLNKVFQLNNFRPSHNLNRNVNAKTVTALKSLIFYTENQILQFVLCICNLLIQLNSNQETFILPYAFNEIIKV